MLSIPSPDSPEGSRRRKAALAGAALLAIAAAAAAFLLAPREATASNRPKGAWRGYRVLLVESGADEGRVMESLAAAGIRSAVSAATEPVVLSDWSRTRTTTLSEALRALVPGDPRLDSYISRLGAWFTARSGGEDYRVVYVPESALSDVSARIAKAMSALGVRYLLPESTAAARPRGSSASSLAAAAAILAAAAAAGMLLGRPRHASAGFALAAPRWRALESAALRAAVALPFALMAWRGGWIALAAALWGLSALEAADALESALEELRFGSSFGNAFRSRQRGGLPALAAPASALIAAAAIPAALPALALAALSSAAAAAAFALLAPRSRRRFSPVAIGKTRPRPSRASLARAVLAGLAVAAAALSAALPGGGERPSGGVQGASYPVPAAARGSVEPMPAEARERLPLESAEGRLPSLASWLAHLAYQESIPYSRLGESRSDPFAPASLPEIGGGAERMDFGDEWACSAYRSIPARSVELMLASQGAAVIGLNSSTAAVGAARDGGTRGARIAQPLAPMSGLLYILLLIPPLARIAASIPIARWASSRRLRQEA